MFSAGDLNAKSGDALGGVNAHAQISACSACHTAPWDAATMADRCMDCHADIRGQMADANQLHSVIAPNLACRACHPEHRGASAALTDLGVNNFPHEALGFSLHKHQVKTNGEPFICNDCHQGTTRPGDMMSSAVDTCDECHRRTDAPFIQKHVLSYGADCFTCHSAHSSFTFRLDGKHADLTCDKCHLEARSISDFQSVSKECASCHKNKDKHEGTFGAMCEACHNASAWKNVSVNHNVFAFKLAGGHLNIKCESCHQNGVFKGTPQDCYSCHKNNDNHNGKFGEKCEACHNPNSWQDANVNHDLFAFKLSGAHSQVNCKSCHINSVYKGTPQDCYSCHQKDDKHNGQLGVDCAVCHAADAWLPTIK